MRWPLVSIIIPVRNEEVNLGRLLASLASQTYPRDRLEYLIINDGSTDRSREMACEFGSRVIDVDRKKYAHGVPYWTEFNKGLGMHRAKGEFVYWLDADMEICVKDFFQLMVSPLLGEKEVIGSFTNEFSMECGTKVNNSLLRFISYDPLQRDPIYKFFSNDIENTVTESYRSYLLCKFENGRIPPCGRTMYRRKELLSTGVGKTQGFYDLDALEIIVGAGFNKFAYVPTAKLRHYHISSFSSLLKKRIRNLKGNYFQTYDTKKYLWFSLEQKRDVFKIIFWILYVNLIIPETILAAKDILIHRDLAFLWRPVVSVVITDAITIEFILSKKGRSLIFKSVSHFFNSFVSNPFIKNEP